MIDFTTNAGADTSMTNTIIGYVPKKEKSYYKKWKQ